MELPDLGKQCCNEFCKQLDFIPLKCLCKRFFCKDHFLAHCLSGECEHYSQFKNEPSFTETSPVYRCSSSDKKCSSSSYIEMPCPKCLKHFCIEHRFHPECPEIDPEVLKAEKERWDTPRALFSKAKAHVEAEVTRKLRISQQSSSKAKTALKIQLMKMKSKAKGEASTPVVDRIYFAVSKPSGCEAKKLESNPPAEEKTFSDDLSSSVAVFVSKDWSLGRVIDSISNICNVKNDNNKGNVPKLRLFRDLDGMCVDISKMEIKLSELLDKEVLLNGDRVILEYVSLEELPVSENQVYFLVRQL